MHAMHSEINFISKNSWNHSDHSRYSLHSQQREFLSNFHRFFSSVGSNVSVTTCARHMCAKLRISHGYIVVFPWILIKPTQGTAGGSGGRGGTGEATATVAAAAAAAATSTAARAGAGAGTATAAAATAEATAGSADICERYRYLREGICVELAYNRRADLLIRNPAVPRLHVSRELYSLREHNI